MLNKPWSLTWYAYIGTSLIDPRFSIQYIGRYTKRAIHVGGIKPVPLKTA